MTMISPLRHRSGLPLQFYLVELLYVRHDGRIRKAVHLERPRERRVRRLEVGTLYGDARPESVGVRGSYF